jgi:hypothetical protein
MDTPNKDKFMHEFKVIYRIDTEEYFCTDDCVIKCRSHVLSDALSLAEVELGGSVTIISISRIM